MIEYNVQRSIFERLSDSATLAAVVTGIYDDVPQSLDAGLASAFPYITIGDDSIVEWDTDTELGAQVSITIHTWSRKKGRTEIKQLQNIVYNLLHRYNLPVQGYVVIDCFFVSSESFLDSDGQTRHGVQNFKITLEG